MRFLLPWAQAFDLYLFHLVNNLCGTWTLDRIAALEESCNLFRGGAMVLPFCWFWFAGDGRERDDRRRVIIAALIGTFAALVAARVLAAVLPFRLRPMHEVGIGYHPPSLQVAMDMEHWSAFPSDTAALHFALAIGIICLSRPLGIAALLYSTVWICLPRIYLGIHYPSDIAAGALLGSVLAWGTIALMRRRNSALGRRVLAPLFALESRYPGPFYTASFALLFEVAAMFDDVRALGRAADHWAHHNAESSPGTGILLLLAGGIMLAALTTVMICAAVILGRRFHQRAGMRQ